MTGQPKFYDSIRVTNIYPKGMATTITLEGIVQTDDEIRELTPSNGVEIPDAFQVDVISAYNGALTINPGAVTIESEFIVHTDTVIMENASDLGDSGNHFANLFTQAVYSSGQALAIDTLSAHVIEIATNNVNTWDFATDGDLEQDATNGANIVFSRSGTGAIDTAAAVVNPDVSGSPTAITERINLVVQLGDPTYDSVRLPAGASPGEIYIIANSWSASGPNVYPPSGDAFLGESTNVPIVAGETLIAWPITSSTWAYVLGV